ncbi:MAG: hypothetical protein WA840_08715 [Caulobacteraceae bacterium]
MRSLSTFIIAGLAFAAASAAAAQTPMNQTPMNQAPPAPTPPSADPGVSGPYAGAGVHGFYDIDARIDHLQQAISALPPGQARRAASQLKAIRSDLKFRKARHNGELRDWDRELISKKLDQLAAQYPALRS